MNIEEQLIKYSQSVSTKIKNAFVKHFDNTEKSVCEAVRGIHNFADAEIERMRQEDNPTIACKKNCPHCCRFRVSVSIAEAVLIAWYVKSIFAPEDLKLLKKILVTLASQTAKMNTVQWTKSGYTCPFLVNNKCHIYSIRPLSCRGWNSTDVNLCEYSLVNEAIFHELPNYQYKLQPFVSVIALDGINEGINELGLDANRVELITALKILICDENAFESWLVGEDIFRDARAVLEKDYDDGEELPPIYQISRKK